MNNPSNDVSPDFQFTAPSMSSETTEKGAFGTIQGPSRPRVARVRKSQHNRTMSGSAARKVDTALNRFEPVSKDFGRASSVDSGVSYLCESGFKMSHDGSSLLGVNRMSSSLNPNEGGVVEGLVLDEINKLRLGDEKASMDANGRVQSINERKSGIWTSAQKDFQVDRSSSRELHHEIKRLNIHDSTQFETSTSSEDEHFNLCGDSQTYVDKQHEEKLHRIQELKKQIQEVKQQLESSSHNEDVKFGAFKTLTAEYNCLRQEYKNALSAGKPRASEN